MEGLLQEHGIASCAVDLPSCGERPPLGDLEADVAAVRKALDDIDGSVTLVGHSYGGMVITGAGAESPSVHHLIYIAAPVTDGKSLVESDFISAEKQAVLADQYELREDGTIGERPLKFKARVLDSLADPELIENALRRLTRQSLAAYAQAPSGVAWASVPSTYLVCLNDGDVDVAEQRVQAARTTQSFDLMTNHFPHLERPELLSAIIRGGPPVEPMVAAAPGAGIVGAPADARDTA
jgi:pimeloyl-ACP methyl ester carboxylesterase